MRKFLRISGIVLGAVVLLGLLALAAAALVPFDPIRPEARDIPDQSLFRLDEKAGLYLADDGHELMVNGGAYGGLTVNGFHPLAGGDLVPAGADHDPRTIFNKGAALSLDLLVKSPVPDWKS
jgi:hypothetical protein